MKCNTQTKKILDFCCRDAKLARSLGDAVWTSSH